MSDVYASARRTNAAGSTEGLYVYEIFELSYPKPMLGMNRRSVATEKKLFEDCESSTMNQVFLFSVSIFWTGVQSHCLHSTKRQKTKTKHKQNRFTFTSSFQTNNQKTVNFIAWRIDLCLCFVKIQNSGCHWVKRWV